MLLLSALAASSAYAQLSGVSITNTGDADATTDSSTDGTQRLSTRTISSTANSIAARYAFVTAADSGAFTNSSMSANNAYRINFTVNVPGAYQITVASNWNGSFTTIDDTTLATVAATADVSALTGAQSGGTLASGSLSLPDPGSRNSGASGQTAFGGTLAATATINGTSNGSDVAHQLIFSWTSSCNSPGGGSLVGGDECAVRAGLAATVSGQSAGDYPGQGARTQANDGHFVNVSIVSLCGNGIVDSAFGETCDQGSDTNGTTGSCCARNCTLRAAGAECRAVAGVCDVAESCTGGSPNCPIDTFEPPTTVCRPTSSGELCDVAETCTGTGADCPADAVAPGGTTCRAVAGACDVPETCDGVGKVCPSDGFAAAGTQCRASAGVCDTAEQCTGGGPNCPSDSKSRAQCRASAGACDPAESCDGASNDCPADAKSTGVCRAAGGVCDVAEVCDGASAACPADVKSTVECRAAAGTCDVAEACDGVGNDCPPDAFEPATVQCRAVSGGDTCDAAEFCTGEDVDCPADVVASSTTVCRGSAGACDIAETCDGAGKTCPADAIEPRDTVCRPVTAGESCDVAESCDGINTACPADAVLARGTTCRGSAGVCDTAEACDGSSKVCPSDAKSTAQCRTAAGVCDVAEACDGVDDDCPVDEVQPDGAICDDSLFCNGVQVCAGGACGGGTSPCGAGESCNESIGSCFRGSCPVTPVTCRTAQKSQILMKNKTDLVASRLAADALIWKWNNGDATTQAEQGDPTSTAEYALCLYAGAAPTLLTQMAVPPGSGWSAAGTRGYQYSGTTTAGGFVKIALKAGEAGKSKALLKGMGPGLPDFDALLPLADEDLPMVVQLRNNQTGICWGGTFAAPTKNQLDQFLATQP